MAALYREAAAGAGHDPSGMEIAVASHGFLAADGAQAKRAFYEKELFVLRTVGRGGAPDPSFFEQRYNPGGMVFAGDPSEITDRIIDLHRGLGHSRHIIQMDIGGMPHRDVLTAIELLGTQVAPHVRAELG
jgi:alkanesulfonate monooxygenase SsuD/methylene tetrahydromethanopterin reductase-like flavin-dependent oxidoreductase (luciferase family)